MAARVSRRWAWLTLAFAGAGVVRAELPDPTRPPARLASPEAVVGADGPVLNSVLLPRQGRASAVIDGQRVGVGERYDGARLTRVTESEAVLVGPAGRRVLQLTPAARKLDRGTPSRAAGAPSRDEKRTRP